MNETMTPLIEHRDNPRVATRSPARFEVPHAIFAQAGAALIDEISACGLRLRTEVQLHPDEELIVRAKGEPLPIHARVVWVREGPPSRTGGRKTWSAGCELQPESIAKVRLVPDLPPRRTPFLGRVLLVAWVIGVTALLVYLYLRLTILLGGG